MTSGPVHINTSIMSPLTILLNSLSLDYFKKSYMKLMEWKRKWVNITCLTEKFHDLPNN